MKRWLIAAAAVTGVMLLPSAASASTCGDDGTTQFFDSQGYYFDFDQSNSTAPDHNDPFGTFEDSGSNGPTDTPPGPFSNSDTYDHWGQLFVGGTDDSHMYWSPDNNSCTDPAAGERDFPVVSLAGLQVQRKIFVNPTSGSLPGARILDLISNPGGSAVTTTVQVGDLNSTENDGDLGSDDTTGVRASSNGDSTASPADLWAVTNDTPDDSDNTIAHIVDGQGGAVKASLFQVGGGTVTSDTPEDNVALGWTVTIPAHGTIGLMSFEVQSAVSPLASAPAVANAVVQANAYENAPLSTLYQGMSPSEQQSVANWNASNVFKAKVKGKRLIVSVSAPGTVAVSDAKAKAKRSVAESAKKKSGLGLKSSSATGNPPQIKVKLKLTKTAQAKLRSTGKVTVKAKITFTPNRGFASTQTKKLKIKSGGKRK